MSAPKSKSKKESQKKDQEQIPAEPPQETAKISPSEEHDHSACGHDHHHDHHHQHEGHDHHHHHEGHDHHHHEHGHGCCGHSHHRTVEDYLQDLPEAIVPHVKKLYELQSQKDAKENELNAEVLRIERKYDEQLQAFYKKRFEILCEGEPLKDFWFTAMLQITALADMIEERDEEAIKHLEDIRHEYLSPTGSSFKISFLFKENPFFENKVLEKIFLIEDEEDSHEVSIKEIQATKIQWKSGKNLTVKKVKVQKAKKGGKPVRVEVEKPVESFFHFFDPIRVPTEEDEPDYIETVQNQIEESYTLASIIKDKLIPQAVSWYVGEIVDDDEEVEDVDDEEDEEDEEDEDN
eukprot:TRINITY_DN3092_c0_g1_i6.p1 TRINITY_DN3092_c0_g1~~TRINITY_DN3092_c0_g1_i6.p1  ORF type:complete len:349 (-),score=121.45 TRINITY_DN3092_c0_g1_i6:142-1188(-)